VIPQHFAPSTYVQYLPTPYQTDEFVGRFLLIFESILGPIERTIDNVALYFDPHLTPDQMLPWLASCVGLELDENWPRTSQRALIASAATIFRGRGTRRGLREHLRVYLGHRPLIVENFDGMRLGQDAALGINTRLGERRPYQLTITAFADRPESVDESILDQIIAFQKPAHVTHKLEVLRFDDSWPERDRSSNGRLEPPVAPALASAGER
jgi:phage tail-like protein